MRTSVRAYVLNNIFLKSASALQVGDFLHKCVEICKALQSSTGKKLVDFKKGLESSEEVAGLRKDVESFAAKFPMPGFSVDGL